MGNVVNRVFESAGPDGKVRGTPQQIIDKYQVLARDAQVSGDRVAAENYLQHAEHYARLLGEAQRQNQESRQQERDERGEDRGEEQGERQQPQPQPHHQQRRQHEPAGLATFGEDERESGPVETPEAGWSRPEQAEGEGQAAPERHLHVINGEERREAPEAEVAAEAPAPKRTRARRKTKPAAEVIEAQASAE